MPRGPAERDRAAPVVGDGDDPPGQVELVGEGAEVVDALLQPARRRRCAPRSPSRAGRPRSPEPGVGAGRARCATGTTTSGCRARTASVTVGSATPLSSTCQVRPTPSSSGVTTSRDHAGSRPLEAGGGGSVASPPDPLAATRRDRTRYRRSVDSHLEYTYDATPDAVFAMFSDPEFLRAKFEATEAIEFDIVECAETPDGGFRIVTNRTVQADIPGFAKKFFKPDERDDADRGLGTGRGRSPAGHVGHRAPRSAGLGLHIRHHPVWSRPARDRCSTSTPGSRSAFRSSAASSSGSCSTRRRRRWTPSTHSAGSGSRSIDDELNASHPPERVG